MPTARSFLSLSVAGGRIYAVGGGTFGVAPFATVEEYDPALDIWVAKLDIPTARLGLSSCVVDDRIYAIGGARDWYPAVSLSTVEEYDPRPLVVDFNGDEVVDTKDLLRLIESWGTDDPAVDIAPRPFGDGTIDEKDLEFLMQYWGQEMPDPALIARWRFDETEGMTAFDSVGVHDAGIVGTPIWRPGEGAVEGALELDGATLAVADLVINPADGPFSVTAWVKGGAPGQAIVSQTDGANWLMADAATGTLMTELSIGGRTGRGLSSQMTITDGVWHRIAFTWDGRNRRLYVDSILVAEDAQPKLAPCYGKLLLGTAKNMAPGTSWSGLIDDVRIYSRVVVP